jgi:hypothetical protein
MHWSSHIEIPNCHIYIRLASSLVEYSFQIVAASSLCASARGFLYISLRGGGGGIGAKANNSRKVLLREFMFDVKSKKIQTSV